MRGAEEVLHAMAGGTGNGRTVRTTLSSAVYHIRLCPWFADHSQSVIANHHCEGALNLWFIKYLVTKSSSSYLTTHFRYFAVQIVVSAVGCACTRQIPPSSRQSTRPRNRLRHHCGRSLSAETAKLRIFTVFDGCVVSRIVHCRRLGGGKDRGRYGDVPLVPQQVESDCRSICQLERGWHQTIAWTNNRSEFWQMRWELHQWRRKWVQHQ